MAKKRILTSELRPGMVVYSQRTSYYVYSFGNSLDECKRFKMKGKAVVLRELTKVRLRKKRAKYDHETKAFIRKDGFVRKNMLLLSHFKHGIVMYFAATKNDCKWFLVEEKKSRENSEVSRGNQD